MTKKITIINQWIEKADHDLGTAKITYLHIPEYKDTVTFHCQRTVEKLLKAYLIFLDIEFRFTHDLVYLIDLISQKDQFTNEFYDKASFLQDFAVEVRYPDDTVELKDKDVEDAIGYAEQFRKLITEKII
ncbi:MAG: hypothetical protein DRI95_02735 [Bacteroidetes bacterium]|nr:MAG: hypothetical protein DRI95_02735 [Bacteroidota bacterium]